MVQLKLNDDELIINIPDNWSDITLEQYESILNRECDNVYDNIITISELCNVDAKVFTDSPIELYNAANGIILSFINNRPEPKNEIIINNVKYFINYADKLTLAEHIDSQADTISEILAVICRPVGEKYNSDLLPQRIELFKSLTCDKVLPLIDFFLSKKMKSESVLALYSKTTDQANQLVADIDNFVIDGDGIKQLPIWRRIKYSNLIRYSKKELLKCSDF